MRSPFAIFTHSAVGIPLRGGAITILKVTACQRDWSQRSSKRTAQAMPHADRLGAALRQKAPADGRYRGAIRAAPPPRAAPLRPARGAARAGAAASSAAVPASSHARKRALFGHAPPIDSGPLARSLRLLAVTRHGASNLGNATSRLAASKARVGSRRPATASGVGGHVKSSSLRLGPWIGVS